MLVTLHEIYVTKLAPEPDSKTKLLTLIPRSIFSGKETFENLISNVLQTVAFENIIKMNYSEKKNITRIYKLIDCVCVCTRVCTHITIMSNCYKIFKLLSISLFVSSGNI